MTALAWLGACLGLAHVVGCQRIPGDNATTNTQSTSAYTSDSTVTSATNSTATATATTTTTTTTGATNETDTATGSPFIMPTDMGLKNECDLWAQDCPSGSKCVPCAVEDLTWDSWQCAPIIQDGGGPGSPCTVMGCEDNCDAQSVCAFAYPGNDGEGMCVGMCMGSEENSSCADPDAVCLIQSNFVGAVCSIPCDPLAPNCPDGSQCHFFRKAFTCRPPISSGQYGDRCSTSALECGPGLACASGDAVPGCAQGGCCSTLCDLNDPMGAEVCPDAANGQQCKPYEPNGEPVPGAEHVGVCSL